MVARIANASLAVCSNHGTRYRLKLWVSNNLGVYSCVSIRECALSHIIASICKISKSITLLVQHAQCSTSFLCFASVPPSVKKFIADWVALLRTSLCIWFRSSLLESLLQGSTESTVICLVKRELYCFAQRSTLHQFEQSCHKNYIQKNLHCNSLLYYSRSTSLWQCFSALGCLGIVSVL